jgi:hypothetical protein
MRADSTMSDFLEPKVQRDADNRGITQQQPAVTA